MLLDLEHLSSVKVMALARGLQSSEICVERGKWPSQRVDNARNAIGSYATKFASVNIPDDGYWPLEQQNPV
jgi:hypothetical protein